MNHLSWVMGSANVGHLPRIRSVSGLAESHTSPKSCCLPVWFQLVVGFLGMKFDVVAYNVLIRACGQALKPELGVALLDEMRANGLHPDVISYTSAMESMLQHGRPAQALALLDEMVRA